MYFKILDKIFNDLNNWNGRFVKFYNFIYIELLNCGMLFLNKMWGFV